MVHKYPRGLLMFGNPGRLTKGNRKKKLYTFKTRDVNITYPDFDDKRLILDTSSNTYFLHSAACGELVSLQTLVGFQSR